MTKSATLTAVVVESNGSFEDLVATAPTRSLGDARDFFAANGLDDTKARQAVTIHLTKAEYWSLVAIGRGAGINAAGVVGEILRGERQGFDAAKAEGAGA